MSNTQNHARLTAEQACRFALGAFYNAAASDPKDGPELIGAWMLELSRKLRQDDITGRQYLEITARWDREDNLPTGEQFATRDNAANNGITTGADNG